MIENLPLQLGGHVHGAVHNGASREEMERLASMVCALGEYYNVTVAKPKLTFMQ
jgi:alkylhydroperoxidase/carboxymuconolactone decarboxylase family protein YurZ